VGYARTATISASSEVDPNTKRDRSLAYYEYVSSGTAPFISVIQDIDAGIIKFDDTADMLKKDDYKRGKAEYKAQLKRGKQKRKEREKQARERQKRKQSADKARKKASEN